MNITTADLGAETTDRRYRLLAQLEVHAHTFTGPVVCVLCSRPVYPDGEVVCVCPSPRVQTIDEVLADLRGTVAFLEAEVASSGRRAETAVQLAREHAAEVGEVLAQERRQVARIAEVAASILGAACPERSAPRSSAEALARMFRPVPRG